MTFERWERNWSALGAIGDGRPLYERLIAAWSEPHRRYHTLTHLEECFAQLDALSQPPLRRAELEMALWFHDAVYDPRRGDNEARSAAWARAETLAAGLRDEAAARIAHLVLCTAHGTPAPEPAAPEAAVIIDVDLAILAAPAARFDQYEQQIREEYAWVPEAEFRRRRRELLAGFLARKHIFQTPHFAAGCEQSARDNLARALSRLR